MPSEAYTGLRRRKQTPWSVTFGDALVSRVIAVGGIGTIAAILLVVLVLLSTAMPLMRRPSNEAWAEFTVPSYQHYGVDEHGLLMWGMNEGGDIEVRSLENGQVLASYPRQGDVAVSCSQLSIDRQTLAIGLVDGSMQTTQLAFRTNLLSPNSLPEGVAVTEADPVQVAEDAVYQWFDVTGVRRTTLDPVKWTQPIQLADSALHAVDYLPDDSENRLSTKTRSSVLALAGNQLIFADIRTSRNRMTRKVTQKVTSDATELQPRNADGAPLGIMLINGVDHAIVSWPNGTLDRFSLADGQPQYMESQSGVIGGGRMTCVAPLLARQTLLCGVDDGRLLGWMVTRAPEDAPEDAAADGFELRLAHETQVGQTALKSISSSEQSHVAITCDDTNFIALVYVTTDSLLHRTPVDLEGELTSVALDPSGQVLVAATSQSIGLSQADIGYPEASWKGFFGRVWYEGHDRPKYIWQSSAGSEKSEIKLSLIPLIFGTLKATVYAMLISVPLSVLAAIYTSEFLSAAVRTRVKPVIELMASLPSVVLGYVAALVAAPFLQDNLMTVLVALMVGPLIFILAGNLWNLLPVDWLVRFQNWRLLGMVACLPVAGWLSVVIGQLMEAIWFDGQIVRWISSGDGSATGGWVLLFLPVLTLVAVLVMVGPMAEWTRASAVKRTPRGFAVIALARLAMLSVLVFLLAWGLGGAFNGLGWDLRSGLFNSYQDRNALLVGGALGFCVIPIIYTLSDDALQAVPQQLRSASLGCGATPWQTTVRVVVPSAMSGLFSAVMIGLGRAVGETMVVLMAAGNTPVMEWNPFNGFRTLSATLATELPEAAKGSTHFRTLFLAALLLFFFTLIANTIAEYVRMRFRKRASQL